MRGVFLLRVSYKCGRRKRHETIEAMGLVNLGWPPRHNALCRPQQVLALFVLGKELYDYFRLAFGARFGIGVGWRFRRTLMPT